MWKFSQLIWCFTALIAAAISYAPASAQDVLIFMRPPAAQTQPVPQTTEDQLTAEDESGRLPAHLQKRITNYPTGEAAGTVIIDTPSTFLYFVLGNGKAIRYGIGVGRNGFMWSGVNTITRKTEWPDWYPPSDMIKRQPYLPRMVAGGPGNPLGARAMYIGGTEYRIHGTNDPTSIGKHVSSGCIRLTNDDVIDLYNRAKLGAKVIVLPAEQQRRPRTPAISWLR